MSTAEEAAAAAEFPWALVAPWFGIAVSLIWNWINYQNTRKARTASVALDQFKSLRGPVDACLGQLREDMSELRSQEAFGGDAAALREALGKIHEKGQNHFNSLQAALAVLDESQFANGNNWSESVDAGWEAFTIEFDRVYSPLRTVDQIKTHIKSSAVKLGACINGVHKRLEDEVRSHA